jgi:hypothetical protein
VLRFSRSCFDSADRASIQQVVLRFSRSCFDSAGRLSANDQIVLATLGACKTDHLRKPSRDREGRERGAIERGERGGGGGGEEGGGKRKI